MLDKQKELEQKERVNQLLNQYSQFDISPIVALIQQQTKK